MDIELWDLQGNLIGGANLLGAWEGTEPKHVGQKFRQGDRVVVKGTVKPVGTVWIDDGEGAWVNWPRKKERLYDRLEDLELAP